MGGSFKCLRERVSQRFEDGERVHVTRNAWKSLQTVKGKKIDSPLEQPLEVMRILPSLRFPPCETHFKFLIPRTLKKLNFAFLSQLVCAHLLQWQ